MTTEGFTIGKRVFDDTPHHWQQIDLDEFKVERPVVLILGGDGTKTDKAANGYAKIISSMLGVFAGDVDILSVNYNDVLHDADDKEQMCAYLVEKLFLPLVSQDGKRIELEKACKNLRQITLFAHCYGKLNYDTILDGFLKECSRLKYSADEVSQMCDQIFMVSYGIWAKESLVPSLNILSINDEMWSWTDRSLELLLEQVDSTEMSLEDRKALKKIIENDVLMSNKRMWDVEKFLTKHERCFVLQENNILRLAGSGYRKDGSDDHPIFDLRRQEDWGATEQVSKAGDYVSRCIACALCNSVANSLLNQKSQELIPLSLSELKLQLESVVRPLNEDKTK